MSSHDVSVLIVEDEKVVAEIYGLALGRRGYRVSVANDGVEGLRMARELRPDFIFLDIRMPKMDGIEVLRQLAGDATMRAIPIVMMTNFDDPSFKKACAELGARDYIVKAGTNPSSLPGIVERWLNPAS